MNSLQHPLPYPVSVAPNVAARSLRSVHLADLNLDDFVRDALDAGSALNFREPGERSLKDELARGGMTTGADLGAYLEKSFQIATQLRHAAVIRADHAAHWLVNCLIQDPLRLPWHVARLDGVSPSSAGAYVIEGRGGRSPWITARELDQTRLMMRLPSRPTWDTFRGTMLEDLNRRILYKRYESSLTQDVSGLEALRAFRGSREMPWLKGNPDDLAFARVPRGQRRVLIDEKCPRQPKDESSPFSIEYDVQLHCYALIADSAQRPVADIGLSHLYVAEDVARMWSLMLDEDPRNIDAIYRQAMFLVARRSDLIQHTLQFNQVDRDLKSEIVQVCAAADARVQAGRFAPWPRKQEVVLGEAQQRAAERLQVILSKSMTTADALEDSIKGYKRQLAEVLGDVDLTNVRSPLPSLSLIKKGKLRVEEAIDALRAVGVNTATLERREERVSYESEEVRDALEAAGLLVENYEDSSLQIGMTRVKRGPAAQAKAELQSRARLLVDDLMQRFEPEPEPEPTRLPVMPHSAQEGAEHAMG